MTITSGLHSQPFLVLFPVPNSPPSLNLPPSLYILRDSHKPDTRNVGRGRQSQLEAPRSSAEGYRRTVAIQEDERRSDVSPARVAENSEDRRIIHPLSLRWGMGICKG